MLSDSLRSSSIISIFISILLFVKHNDTASSYQQSTHDDFGVYRFFQEHERQADGDYHTELVDGRDTRHVTQLQGSEIKEP